MRRLLFALMFIPSIAFAEIIELKEPCTDDQGATISNLKQCDVLIRTPGSDVVIATLTIPASSPTGCQVVTVSTLPVDKLIEGMRSVSATCQTTSGKVSQASNSLSHNFRGRATAAPTVSKIQE